MQFLWRWEVANRFSSYAPVCPRGLAKGYIYRAGNFARFFDYDLFTHYCFGPRQTINQSHDYFTIDVSLTVNLLCTHRHPKRQDHGNVGLRRRFLVRPSTRNWRRSVHLARLRVCQSKWRGQLPHVIIPDGRRVFLRSRWCSSQEEFRGQGLCKRDEGVPTTKHRIRTRRASSNLCL